VIRLLPLIMAAAMLGAGCASDPHAGYAAASAFPEQIHTIAVPIFENDTLVRDIEFDLTDALVKEIEARTPYKVTRSAVADSILLGHVRKVELDQLSKSSLTGLGQEVVMRVTIDFEWRDLTTEKSIVDRKSFSGNSLFLPSAPASERLELGRAAVVQQLARDVVAEMRGSW
jgi:Lipopolysaccharide-assembly